MRRVLVVCVLAASSLLQVSAQRCPMESALSPEPGGHIHGGHAESAPASGGAAAEAAEAPDPGSRPIPDPACRGALSCGATALAVAVVVTTKLVPAESPRELSSVEAKYTSVTLSEDPPPPRLSF